MASNGSLEELLPHSCDALAHILDDFRQYTPAQRQSECARIVRGVGTLFESLESLEREARYSNYQFYGASRRICTTIRDIVDRCGQLARILAERIEDNTLRDGHWVGGDIASLMNEVNWMVEALKGRRQTTETGNIIDDLERRLEDAVSRLDDAQVEVAQYRSLHNSSHFPTPNSHPASMVPEPDSRPKLGHIKRLHAAIFNLGYPRPRQHGLDSWPLLSGELPTMLDIIKNAHEQLLEHAEHPSTLPSSSSPRSGHNRTRPELNPLSSSFASWRPIVASESSSAGSSNASRPRASTSTLGSGSQSNARRRRSSGGLPSPLHP